MSHRGCGGPDGEQSGEGALPVVKGDCRPCRSPWWPGKGAGPAQSLEPSTGAWRVRASGDKQVVLWDLTTEGAPGLGQQPP